MKQKILSSREEIQVILKKCHCKSVMVVCDRFVMGQPLQQYLATLPCKFSYFSDFQPNPVYQDALAGARLFKADKCDFIISIGGGSAIDTAKSIKMFADLDLSGNCLDQLYADNGIGHLAIPTTAGTGSEATRFAVIYLNGVKQSLNHESLIPDYVLLEPSLLKSLPSYQKRATMCDALCQAIESYWSVNATASSQTLAKQAIILFLSNYRDYLANRQGSYSAMLQASHLAGQAINLTQTTAAHAMSYKITSEFGAAHGQAVAMCLRYLWPYLKEHTADCCDQRGVGWLQKTLARLDEMFDGDGPAAFAKIYKQMGFKEYRAEDEQLEELTAGVNPERLANFPIRLTRDNILDLYRQILNYYSVICPSEKMRQLQLCELDILRQVDKICRKYKLTYYLAEGTLLGAVRHHGFIPWDDDMDIMMPRHDYDIFIKEASEEFAGTLYQVQTSANVPAYWLGNAKVRYLGASEVRQAQLKKLLVNNGPFIDVFPLDGCYGPDDKRTEQQVKDFHACHAMLMRKAHVNANNTWRKKAVGFLALFHSTAALQKKMAQAQCRYPDQTAWLWSSCSLYPYKREIFKPEMLQPARFVEFEGASFPVPQQAEAMLTQIYHDYKKMPPVSQRVNKHSWQNEP